MTIVQRVVLKLAEPLRRQTMVAFHKELRVSLTIANEVTFRNKIPTWRATRQRLEPSLRSPFVPGLVVLSSEAKRSLVVNLLI